MRIHGALALLIYSIAMSWPERGAMTGFHTPGVASRVSGQSARTALNPQGVKAEALTVVEAPEFLNQLPPRTQLPSRHIVVGITHSQTCLTLPDGCARCVRRAFV